VCTTPLGSPKTNITTNITDIFKDLKEKEKEERSNLIGFIMLYRFSVTITVRVSAFVSEHD